MRLDELPATARVFIDANVFIYHFTDTSPECTRFLDRCEARELSGATSVSVLLEVLHRLMMVEAVTTGAIRPPKLLEKLRRRPDVVRSLSAYQAQTARIPAMGITVYPLTEEVLAESQHVRRAQGLLVRDSLLLAAMRAEGIRMLASRDADFERIADIVLASPADV